MTCLDTASDLDSNKPESLSISMNFSQFSASSLATIDTLKEATPINQE